MFGDMASVDDDIQLVRDLIAWADSNAARVARAIGVANTTLNRFSNGTAKTRLHRDTLSKLREAYPEFPGFAETPPSNGVPFKMEGASSERMRRDLPVYGTAIGSVRQIDGDAIEQITLNQGETPEYLQRPVILNGRTDVYGLWVSGSSMEPRYCEGESIVIDPKGRLNIGDHVVLYLRPLNPDEDDGQAARAVLVKRLVRRTASYIELEQYSPAKVFRVDAADVVNIHRVMPWSELLS